MDEYPMDEDHPAHDLFYSVEDPMGPLPQCPAMTTLLYRVCDKDTVKFEEATRLIGLFMAAAYEKGKTDGRG